MARLFILSKDHETRLPEWRGRGGENVLIASFSELVSAISQGLRAMRLVEKKTPKKKVWGGWGIRG